MRRDHVERVRGDIVSLAHRGLDAREFSLAAARALRRAVGFDGVCVVTMDPATTLPTGEVVENGLPESAMARLAEIEVAEPDFIKFADLAQMQQPVASLSEATGGVLERSTQHRELKRPNGFGDELRAALVSESGTWGGITLLREAGRAPFAPADTSVVASLTGLLVEGLRRAVLLVSEAGTADAAPGLVLLADDNTIETANAAAEAWLSEFDGERLQRVIGAVASRARTAAAGLANGHGPATARIRTPAGQWLFLRGSMLGDRAAVLVEPARSPELAPLIAEAHGLTERERAITGLVAQGLSTNEIAGRLYLSPYTVQDHLKAIFSKVDVGSRGELVARLYLQTAF